MRMVVPAILALGAMTTLAGIVIASGLATVIGAAVILVGIVVAVAGRPKHRNRPGRR